ncbi:MAG: hypothetical protein OXC19_13340 [Bryobacterales bacterium]|nr:hypothetical protein [Bryobacterales bacterium]
MALADLDCHFLGIYDDRISALHHRTNHGKRRLNVGVGVAICQFAIYSCAFDNPDPKALGSQFDELHLAVVPQPHEVPLIHLDLDLRDAGGTDRVPFDDRHVHSRGDPVP